MIYRSVDALVTESLLRLLETIGLLSQLSSYKASKVVWLDVLEVCSLSV